MTAGRSSGVSDDEQSGGSLQNTAQAVLEAVGVQGGKALIEDDEVSPPGAEPWPCRAGCARRGRAASRVVGQFHANRPGISAVGRPYIQC
jgi:hypothetical protein